MTTEEKELKAATLETKRILNILDKDVGESLDEKHQEIISDNDRINRAKQADIFYKQFFYKKLQQEAYLELVYRLGTADTMGQIMFHKGILYGLQMIDDWFKEQVNISLNRFEKPEKPTNEPIDPVGKFE